MWNEKIFSKLLMSGLVYMKFLFTSNGQVIRECVDGDGTCERMDILGAVRQEILDFDQNYQQKINGVLSEIDGYLVNVIETINITRSLRRSQLPEDVHRSLHTVKLVTIRFPDDDVLKAATEAWFQNQTEDFYFKGIRGPLGVSGPPGAKGQRGNQGVPGQVGPGGLPGMKGEVGEQGYPGEDGMEGEKGATGPDGFGETGDLGEKGETGEKGVNGDSGDPGLPGLPGAKGDKGEKGA